MAKRMHSLWVLTPCTYSLYRMLTWPSKLLQQGICEDVGEDGGAGASGSMPWADSKRGTEAPVQGQASGADTKRRRIVHADSSTAANVSSQAGDVGVGSGVVAGTPVRMPRGAGNSGAASEDLEMAVPPKAVADTSMEQLEGGGNAGLGSGFVPHEARHQRGAEAQGAAGAQAGGSREAPAQAGGQLGFARGFAGWPAQLLAMAGLGIAGGVFRLWGPRR